MHSPLTAMLNRGMDSGFRNQKIAGVQFSEPAGDPGWFGPDSAMWYVHSHTFCTIMGFIAAGRMELLHPDFAWMAPDHSRIFSHTPDGKPTYQLAPMDQSIRRAGESLSFFQATAFGPSIAAEKATKAVAGMHHRVKGVRPDGKPYDADDPHTLRWAYATVVWGFAAAHERYHPKPLADINDYYREYVKVGEALGGTDLPSTKQEVLDYLDWSVMECALSPMAIELLKVQFIPASVKPIYSLIDWAAFDLQPEWGQLMFGQPRSGRAATKAKRFACKKMLNTLERIAGPAPELVESEKRVAAVAPKPVSV